MRNFRVVASVMMKGGARKTTTAAMLAFALVDQGAEDVLVIDADTYTQGLTEWVSTIMAEDPDALPFDAVQWSRSSGDLLVPFIQRKAAEFGAGWVVLDMGAEDPNAIRQLLPILDLAIAPCGPEQAEIARLAPTRTVLESGKREVPMRTLLTRVDVPGKGAAYEAREALTRDRYRVMTAEVERSRRRYADAFGTVPDDLGAYADVAREVAWMVRG